MPLISENAEFDVLCKNIVFVSRTVSDEIKMVGIELLPEQASSFA